MSTAPKEQSALRHDAQPRPPRQPRPGERVHEFLKGHDRYLIELRDDGPHGFDVQVWKNEEISMAWRRPDRPLALTLAEQLRVDIETGRFNP